ncbi:MAG: DNA-processing protein DprA [Oscillospiraceae bacterium]|jgi:DNA processing protein|nr:DNA-processing protein DprA [Oscillospiraceae bacterium]
MADTMYYLWLQCALGVSSALRTQEILAAFAGGAREIFGASDYERRVAGVFTNTQLARLQATPLERAEKILEECARQNAHILSPQDAEYPALLLEIPNYPLALYARGSLGRLLDRLPLAIVGTRRASSKSVDIAARLGADLTRAGCAVVSGGALGIDSAAHWGVLHAGGVTVAVLGCGLDVNYPAENASLRAKTAEHGAVVTEYPFGTAPAAKNFPIRNRLISGMSAGTVVIEAGEKSGSLITATCAAEQGRDVFAVPGDAFGSTYTGGNKLIRDGAKPVFSAMDILEEYELIYPELLDMRRAERDLERPAVKPENVSVKKKQAGAAVLPPAQTQKPQPIPAPSTLSPLEQRILQLLANGPVHIDRIMKETDAPYGALFAALMNLELQELVQQAPGKMYTISKIS